MLDEYRTLPVDEILFDTDNPRIKMALEKYGTQLNAERIHFALRSATDGERGTSSYSQLRDSILASGGVTTPITVTTQQAQYVCIDGNTRLAIYKQFLRDKMDGSWSNIRARVLEGATSRDVETVRVSAHLVGAREWPAYEKAQYLYYLRTQEFMDYSEMIALCGGNKQDIERQIDAYQDMNEYYRDLVDDTAFHIDRFSGFVELQRPRIKESIFDASLGLKDFGEWIRDGKIYRLADVRQLPRVLADEEARGIFLTGGPRSIEDAIAHLNKRPDHADQNPEKITLASATPYQLAEALTSRINELPFAEVRTLKARENTNVLEQLRSLEDLSDALQILLNDVAE